MLHNLEGVVAFAKGLAPFAPAEIQIRGGKAFNPLEPESYDYSVEDVAHSLASTPRWGGHACYADGSPLIFTVAQHSVHVADLVQMARRKLVPDWDWDSSPSPALLGLLHDGPEMAVTDIVRPVKKSLGPKVPEIEDRLMADMIRRFNIPVNAGIEAAVKIVDNLMVFLERDALMGTPCKPYGNEADHPGLSLFKVIPEFRVWTPIEAKERFLAKYGEIVIHDGNHIPLQYLNRGYGL